MRDYTVEDIERLILRRKNEAHRASLQALLQTKLMIAGLSRQDYLDVLREIQPHLPDPQEEFIWLNLLQDMWGSQYFETRLLGLQLMLAIPYLVDAHLWAMLDHWTNELDNWALADWLGHVRAIAISKSPQLVMRMAPWLQSSHPWRRRSALVSLVSIDQQNHATRLLLEPQEIFAFLDPILQEQHEAVRKAMAWLLRLVAEKHPAELADFLRSVESKMSAEFIRELKSALAQSPAFKREVA